MLTGRTTLVGLIGNPVEHSVSPAMHNAAFAARGLDWAYVPLPVDEGRVEDAVRGLVALGFAGANVTAPHKAAAAAACETELDSNSPYNTRKFPGLPPTPIANPGLASIEAAAHPAKVDYLYFVRKPDKQHHFFTASYSAFVNYERAHGYIP